MLSSGNRFSAADRMTADFAAKEPLKGGVWGLELWRILRKATDCVQTDFSKYPPCLPENTSFCQATCYAVPRPISLGRQNIFCRLSFTFSRKNSFPADLLAKRPSFLAYLGSRMRYTVFRVGCLWTILSLFNFEKAGEK